MRFVQTRLNGAYLVEPEPFEDERGTFQRVWCDREFREMGLATPPAQENLSTNRYAHTLRGLHLQWPPESEAKLVRCTHGAIWDVIVDLRPDSPSFLEHYGTRLDAENRHGLYVPELFAHGYLTLEGDTHVHYQVSRFYAPGHEHGLRWDDPSLGITWPSEVRLVSEKDAAWPDVDPATLKRDLYRALGAA